MPAGRAEIVRALQLAAIRAFLERLDRQRVMAAAHVALRLGLLENGLPDLKKALGDVLLADRLHSVTRRATASNGGQAAKKAK